VKRSPPEPAGALVPNLLHFSRLLRAAGLPIGTGRIIEALRALAAVGIHRRDDFYWTLHSVFVNRKDQHDLFDQTFRSFWKQPENGVPLSLKLLPESRVPAESSATAPSRRVREASAPGMQTRRASPGAGKRMEADVIMTYSDRERLRERDFEEMSADEVRRARDIIAQIRMPIPEVKTRRFRLDRAGARIDMRATLTASVRAGTAGIPLRWRAPRRRPPPLVILCDISGSMERYSRMLLHFMHALTSDRDRIHCFVFGTRLTNITRQLRSRDVDEALSRVGRAARDWSGGTRIGECLEIFNRLWSRRVLAQGAVVLLITDGLDRDAGHGLARQMQRLHRSCRRLIWLNPLLRYEGFEPRAVGVRKMLPHVDDFRPVHNLQSLEELAHALSEDRTTA
jgi:uncharacterized protein with von Willebrand factor type A (vWA) domain